MRYLILVFLMIINANTSYGQFLTDTLKQDTLVFFETRRSTDRYRIDSTDVLILDSIKVHYENVNKLNLWYDKYYHKEGYLSSEGKRYFRDLTANVFLEFYLDLMSNGYDRYLFDRKYISNKKAVRIGVIFFDNYPQIQNPEVLDLISFNTINSETLYDCGLFENINQGNKKFYGDVFEKYEDYIKWKITKESDSCMIKNLNIILESIEYLKNL